MLRERPPQPAPVGVLVILAALPSVWVSLHANSGVSSPTRDAGRRQPRAAHGMRASLHLVLVLSPPCTQLGAFPPTVDVYACGKDQYHSCPPSRPHTHARTDSGFGFWRSREPTMARLTPLPVRPSLLLGSLLSSWASLDWACLTLYSFLAAACSGADADACADHEMSRIEMTVSRTFDLDGRSARLEEHGGRHTAPDIAKHTITARLACAPSPQAARPLVSVSSRLLALHRLS